MVLDPRFYLAGRSREIFKEFVDIFIRRWDDPLESGDEREMRRGRYSGSRRQGDLHG
jgi:hypothetical protein